MDYVLPVVYLALMGLLIASAWVVFTKAGEPGWASLIPIYNVMVEFRIAGHPMWWVLLLFVPLVNVIIAVIVALDLAKSFGKGVGFGLGLMFLGFIFLPLLAFGDAEYIGPGGRRRKKQSISRFRDEEDDEDDDRPRGRQRPIEDEQPRSAGGRTQRRNEEEDDEDDLNRRARR